MPGAVRQEGWVPWREMSFPSAHALVFLCCADGPSQGMSGVKLFCEEWMG